MKQNKNKQPLLFAVIMAGGKGRRFWPRSRECRPKQMLAIGCKQPLVRETAARIFPLIPPERVFVSAGVELGPQLAPLLPEIPPENFVLEPIGRDTAPGLGLALERIRARVKGRDAETVVAVLPADHAVQKPARFRKTLDLAARTAFDHGLILTIGIVPDRPSPAYGYLQPGLPIKGAPGIFQVKKFIEKPDLAAAKKYLKQGFLWNAGMFIFRLDVIAEAYQKFLPDMARGLSRIGRALGKAEEKKVIEREFPKLEKISIDFGLMEKAEGVALVKGDFGWRDVGGWEACYRLRGGDGRKNVSKGPAEFLDAAGCYVESEKFAALVGVKDLVVIETEDALLILHRDREAELKELMARLGKKGLRHLL